ncbi:MAG: hypothetical protein GQ535_17690 [Rhodobacteraceae bacterium]|nr:hypothetical protein [Paracoccaceae bacterium]
MTYSTTIGRAALAMLVGALVGGNLSMGMLVMGFGPPAEGEAVQIWLIMQAYWAGGMLIFAVIPFILMHISNLRQWYAMTGIGVLTMVSLSLYAFKGVGTGSALVMLAATGGIVGWVIWRVAYRRA